MAKARATATFRLDKNTKFPILSDIEDEKVLKVLAAVCKTLNITIEQAADAFGDYWVNDFAPKIYPIYYKGPTCAKDFLLKMDAVHANIITSIASARPPRFEYEWQGATTLIMKYKSNNGLIDILVGLIKGVGKHYKESLIVTKLGPDKVQVQFL